MNSTGKRWSTCRLAELVVVVRQVVNPAELNGETSYVGLEHVESQTGLHTSVNASSADLRSAKFRFETGDILFGKLRPNLRKVAVARCTGICSTDLIPLRPVDAAVAFLLAFQLRTESFTADVSRLVAGQSLPRVAVRDLLSLQLPVPPASELAKVCEFAKLLDEAARGAAELNMRVRGVQLSAAAALWPDAKQIDQGSAESFRLMNSA